MTRSGSGERSRRRLAVLALTLAACERGSVLPGEPRGAEPVAAASGGAAPATVPAPTPSAATGGAAPSRAPRRPAEGCLPSFADLAAEADPAVVFVRTEEARQQRVVGRGFGTGFVFDADGHVLTNDHVIADATTIQVTFSEGRTLEAKVIGRDSPTDLALLRVDQPGLPHLTLGESATLRVGDWVLAIGNPFGLSHTVSAGILSAKGRTRNDLKGLDESGYYDFLQTDASINPGNSGGPLLDLAGQVVGINTAVRASANSIGFAIPIDMVKELLPRLLRDGKIHRSAMGLSVSALSLTDAERAGLGAPRGALVKGVAPGGPAALAGVLPGDVVVAFGGLDVEGPEQLRWRASVAGVGSDVSVRLARGGERVEVILRMGALPEDAAGTKRGDVLYP